MSSRNLLNIGLLLFIAVLASLVIFEPGKESTPEPQLLTQLKSEDIHHIQIIRADKDNITLEKIQGSWSMRTPYALPANDYRVQSILQLTQTQSSSQHRLTSADRAKFKLDKPAASIIFNNELRLDFGSKAPLDQLRYIAIQDTLHLIADTTYYHLLSETTQYLSHTLLPANTQLTRLELPDLTLMLSNGQWQVSPVQENISADAITDLLNEWRHAQALLLKPINSSPKQKQTIKLFIQDQKQPLEFVSYIEEDHFILASKERGLQYLFPEEKMQALLKLPEPLDDDAPADADMTMDNNEP
ncbi:MAG: DUF4340 domain-containing protein [Gammaproteobacteria bacterium]|nr:DUF4340 domain-containing protein [Gammaproteobacteria bacterium]